MAVHPYRETKAAQMLAAGLHAAALERKLSLREIGRRLGYSQPVVLSHMANGRVPIPLDRAEEIAREVGLPIRPFLETVLEQRHPAVARHMLGGTADPFYDELASLASKPLSALPASHQEVIREAVRDPDPSARWLSVAEVAVVKLLRELFPHMRANGLAAGDRETIRIIANLLNEKDESRQTDDTE